MSPDREETTPGPRVGVAIPAAGLGRRMGGRKKQYLELAGTPLLLRTVRPFLADRRVVAVAVALPSSDLAEPPPWLRNLDERVRLVGGGESRQESVWSAIRGLPEDVEVVVVHDGARPLVTAEVIDRCIREAAAGRGAIAGWPAVDTIKEVDGERRVVRTPDRTRLWHAQTPQAFPREMIVAAYRAAGAEGGAASGASAASSGAGERESVATDDAALVERLGGEVVTVEGSPRNLKVTRPQDLALAETLIRLAEEEEGEGEWEGTDGG